MCVCVCVCVEFSSVQCKMVSMRSEKPIRAPPRLSEVSPIDAFETVPKMINTDRQHPPNLPLKCRLRTLPSSRSSCQRLHGSLDVEFPRSAI